MRGSSVKRILIAVAFVFTCVIAFRGSDAVANLLTDTALQLRVNTEGTSTTPQVLVTATCTPGDQYYACSTYTTQNSLKSGSIRVNFNGAAGYIPVYTEPR